jgi:serpin B
MELIPDGLIDNETKLLLVNALYFSDDWDIAFDASKTDQADFNLQDASKVQVPMMHQSASSIPYYAGDGYQAVKLYYKDKLYALTLIIPDQDKFVDIAQSIDDSFISNIWDNLQDSDVVLSLPRFRIRGRFSQASSLIELGMVDAFNRTAADFSGMDGQKDLWLRELINGCYFEVKESGVNMVQPAEDSPNAITLTADRSFLFLLHDDPGTIFFIGQFTTPESSA